MRFPRCAIASVSIDTRFSLVLFANRTGRSIDDLGEAQGYTSAIDMSAPGALLAVAPLGPVPRSGPVLLPATLCEELVDRQRRLPPR